MNRILLIGLMLFCLSCKKDAPTSPSTPPPAPVANAASTVMPTSFTANWSASPGATGYYLDVATNSNISTFVAFHNRDVANVTQFSLTGLTPGVLYYYYLRAYNNSGSSSYSNMITVTTVAATMPVVSTSAINNITSSSANSGGNVSSDGGAAVTVRGVCWNTISLPTIYNPHTSDAAGTGVFSSTMNSLNAGTTYYARAYATSNVGTGYGNEQTFLTAPPALIANAASTVMPTSFTANWSASPGATGYYLDVANNSEFTAYQGLDVGDVMQHSVPGLSAGTHYYYDLRSSNRSGTSGNSKTITVSAFPSTPKVSIVYLRADQP